MTPSSQPFFIIGVHRSGTTLLRFMLCRHSRIYIPPETDFIPYFFGKNPNEQLTDRRLQQITYKIFTRYRFKEEWQGNRPTLPDLLCVMPDRTPASFLNSLFLLYAKQYGKFRWGDKTPIYASYVELLHKIFPNAQFIHILRDPFDASLSLLDKYQDREFHIDIYFAARNWVRRIDDITKAKQLLAPELYHELRYEDLVRNPEENLREICSFLGETYEPAMVEQHLLAKDIIAPDSHFFANVRNPVNTGSIGRGRKLLSLQDKHLIQRVAGSTMQQLGYEFEDLGTMTLPEITRMELLRAKYNILQAGRRIMTSINLMPPI